MFDAEAAKKIVRTYVPGATIQKCVSYKGNFLLRVAYSSADEKDFDPFYLVDAQTGAVEEFSVMTDGDPEEIAKAFGVSL